METNSPNSPNASDTSHILNQNKKYKTKLRKILRIYSFILIFTILCKYIFGVIIWWQIVLSQLNNLNNSLNIIELILWISFIVIQSILFIISIIIPDLLMIIVSRLYFTECYLYVKTFVNSIESMNIDEIINNNLCETYIEMNKKINEYCNLFYFWIINILLQMIMSCWHSISMYIHPYTYINITDYDTIIWLIYNSIEGLIYLLTVIFVLCPVMLMTEHINTLKIIINNKLNEILKIRLHFHNELILTNLINAITQKQNEFMDNNNNIFITDEIEIKQQGNENINELLEGIISHSKQECALEILNRLKYLIKKYSSCYKLIGIEIDRSSIKHFIIALILTNILSFMWDSF